MLVEQTKGSHIYSERRRKRLIINIRLTVKLAIVGEPNANMSIDSQLPDSCCRQKITKITSEN